MTPAAHTRHLQMLTASPRLPLIASLAVRFAVMVTTWEKRRRTRLNLGRLDDRILADVGLTRHQARTESARLFWQP
ncbi:Uncharacterized conserved protein YjiS, DUF1127 family [Cribrihabitans marinus]|uniref:Uncharacterized conserved protein YjiS, DUF1127 family n=1 Tax=Cribrihabitans marinus TaxID=1227549 RepID=A0A1H6VKM4_9RHOB|nr:DUF1127 domain-containing protein [Cribrihabitans marinus]GGH25581.1 hypothetical protein GCM10010973_12830 [Cribrihabitans marinus]SEJ05153.1 Uncharacterized conserved protein YjiS, DUF1127 family [Cribrihabitans marinus]